MPEEPGKTGTSGGCLQTRATGASGSYADPGNRCSGLMPPVGGRSGQRVNAGQSAGSCCAAESEAPPTHTWGGFTLSRAHAFPGSRFRRLKPCRRAHTARRRAASLARDVPGWHIHVAADEQMATRPADPPGRRGQDRLCPLLAFRTAQPEDGSHPVGRRGHAHDPDHRAGCLWAAGRRPAARSRRLASSAAHPVAPPLPR